jgi:hypothetical protein
MFSFKRTDVTLMCCFARTNTLADDVLFNIGLAVQAACFRVMVSSLSSKFQFEPLCAYSIFFPCSNPCNRVLMNKNAVGASYGIDHWQSTRIIRASGDSACCYYKCTTVKDVQDKGRLTG